MHAFKSLTVTKQGILFIHRTLKKEAYKGDGSDSSDIKLLSFVTEECTVRSSKRWKLKLGRLRLEKSVF